jgi:drug/metabolite transporter (DMT)-like permease
MIRSDKERGTLEMVIAMVLSGTIGYFVLSSGQSFWNVVFFRCLIGAISLGFIMAITRTLTFSVLTKHTILLIVLGGFALVGNWVLLFASFEHIPFSIATIVYHMQPIMLVIMATIMSRQLPSFHLVFWLAIAFGGLWLVVELSPAEILHSIQTTTSSDTTVLGLILALSAAFLYTATTLLTKKVSHVPSRLVALIHVITGIVFLLPMANFNQLPMHLSQWGDLIALGALNTAFMYIMLYNAFQRLTTHLIAILSFIYPVTALFVDYVAFDNSIDLIQAIGVVLILTAVCAVKFNWTLQRLIGALMTTKSIARKTP